VSIWAPIHRFGDEYVGEYVRFLSTSFKENVSNSFKKTMSSPLDEMFHRFK